MTMCIASFSQAILDDVNRIAHNLFALQGGVVDEDFRFYRPTNDLQYKCWNAAVIAYCNFMAADVEVEQLQLFPQVTTLDYFCVH